MNRKLRGIRQQLNIISIDQHALHLNKRETNEQQEIVKIKTDRLIEGVVPNQFFFKEKTLLMHAHILYALPKEGISISKQLVEIGKRSGRF